MAVLHLATTWEGSIFPVNIIQLKLLIRSIFQLSIVFFLLFTSHTLSVFFFLVVNVLHDVLLSVL